MSSFSLHDEWGDFTGVPNVVLDNMALLGDDALKLFLFLRRQGRGPAHEVSVAYDEISGGANLHRTRIKGAIDRLEALGLLERTKRFGAPVIYVLKRKDELSEPSSTDGCTTNDISTDGCTTAVQTGVLQKYKRVNYCTSNKEGTKKERDAREPVSESPEPGLPEPLAGPALRYYLAHRADACLKHGCSPPRVYERETRRMAEILSVEFGENFTGAEALECITAWLNAEPDPKTKQNSFAPGFCIPFVRSWIADYPRRQAEARAVTAEKERRAAVKVFTPEEIEEQRLRSEAAKERAMAMMRGNASRMSMPMGQIIGPGEPQSIPKTPILEIDDGEMARRRDYFRRELEAQEVTG